jgi:hypothetical protein
MTGASVKVSGFVHFYTWIFVLAISLWPVVALALRARHVAIPTDSWLAAVGTVGVIQALFWYVQSRCSSEKLSYWDGLLIVTASMMTGWVYSSMLVVFPVLLFTFLSSVGFALYCEVRGVPSEAAELFHKLVARLYRNRMRQ